MIWIFQKRLIKTGESETNFMGHFKWMLCKKYKEFNSNSIVRIIKESFVYNLLKALIVIMMMIFLIFQVKPNKAYIYAELEQIEVSSLDYQAEVLSVGEISHSYTEISSMDKILIDLNGLSINDIDYSDGEYLEICPIGSPSSFVNFCGMIDKAYFYNVNSNINQYRIIYSNSSSYYFIGEQHLKIDYGTTYVVNTNSGERKKLDYNENLVLMNTSCKNIINEYKKLIDDITEDAGSISEEHENEYLNYTHIIHKFSNEEAYSVRVYTESADSESIDGRLETDFVDFNSIYSGQIVSCKVMASGKLAISYTPSAEEYVLKKQELYLRSDDSSLNISYDIKNGTAFISGYVNEATLSQMNLFPNFWSWYFSNIYMAPLTLISTVFAAVSMMNASKRNKQFD